MSIKQNQSGFSVFELLVAVAIGAMIMTIAVPSFSNSIANQRMVGANNELVMALTLAKSEAIKRVAYVSVCPSGDGVDCGTAGGGRDDWNAGWIVFVNSDMTSMGTVDAGDEVLRIYPVLHDQVTITATGNTGNFVSFRPSGTLGTNAANITGTLTTCDRRGADKAAGIVLQASGRWHITHDKTHDDSDLSCPDVT